MFKNRREVIESFPRHGLVAEVGVLTGTFSVELLRLNSPKYLWLVDPWRWPCGEQRALHAATREAPESGDAAYVSVIKKFWMEPDVSILRLDSHVAVQCFQPGSLDLVYIDGDHSFGACLEDIHMWYTRLNASTGILSGHDFNIASVKRAVEMFGQEHPDLELHFTEEPVQSWWFTRTSGPAPQVIEEGDVGTK